MGACAQVALAPHAAAVRPTVGRSPGHAGHAAVNGRLFGVGALAELVLHGSAASVERQARGAEGRTLSLVTALSQP